jgi:hypothetical protein
MIISASLKVDLLLLIVRRDVERFPADFMFELTENEWEILRRQIGTSRLNEHGGI